MVGQRMGLSTRAVQNPVESTLDPNEAEFEDVGLRQDEGKNPTLIKDCTVESG
jgi:hypothetical protein